MTKTYIFVFAIILVIATVSFFVFRGDSVKNLTNYPPKNTTIVAFGDSLVFGTGSTKGNDFVSLLSRAIFKLIKNLGVPGNTTTQGLARIDEVLAQDPGVVILLLGGNDYLQRMSRDETFKNLDSIITRLHASGAMVVLLGVQGSMLGDAFKKQFEILSEKHNVAYVKNVLDGIKSKDHLMSDRIHPNDVGYAMIAEKIEPVLSEIIK